MKKKLFVTCSFCRAGKSTTGNQMEVSFGQTWLNVKHGFYGKTPWRFAFFLYSVKLFSVWTPGLISVNNPCFRTSKIHFSPLPILICLCSWFSEDVEYGRNIFGMELSYQKSHGMTTTISISRYLNRLFKFTIILSDLIRLVPAVREFHVSNDIASLTLY